MGYDDANNNEGLILSNELVDKFIDTWAKYDPDGSGFIKA